MRRPMDPAHNSGTSFGGCYLVTLERNCLVVGRSRRRRVRRIVVVGAVVAAVEDPVGVESAGWDLD